jgi:hypothetical protein
MSEIELALAATFLFIIIGGFISFAIWQFVKLQNPDHYAIDPQSIAPFKEYNNTKMDWLVVRVRQWPPIKCGISFIAQWPFINIKRHKDQCGLKSIYLNNQVLIGQINIYNRYETFIECMGKEIHAIPDLADFTNICRKISYVLPDTGQTILSIEPYFDLGSKIDYSFTIDGKSYVLRSGLSNYRLSATLFCDGVAQAVLAVVSAKHITAAILLSKPDYLALLLCIDIFNRRAN